MFVIKASGEREEFSRDKIRGTCLKAGASKELADKVADQVYKRAYNGVSTKKILDIILSLLKKYPIVAARYDLKRAIMSLGPSGFPFEKFFANILENYGYKTEINKKLKGLCVTHEIDIIAKKDLKYMIECKYHNNAGIYTDLKVALYTYARFIDLRNFFDMPWLVCNTKISRDAIQYTKCNNIKVTSWRYPSNENLQTLIENKKLYPITLLKSINNYAKKMFMEYGFILVKDVFDYDFRELKKKLMIPNRAIANAIKEAESLYYSKANSPSLHKRESSKAF